MIRISLILFIGLNLLLANDNSFKLIKANGDVLYSQDGIKWLPFKSITLKYATQYPTFRFNFNEDISISKIDIYDLTGTKQILDVSISNTELKIELKENKVYYATLLIENNYYNFLIMKF